MQFLIWGTGKTASRYVDAGYLDFFKTNEIVAFVDSDREKWGKDFFGKKIIAPSQIEDYLYDRIVICSIYEDEIRAQLQLLGIDTNAVETIDSMKKCVKWYFEETKELSKKKFVILTDKEAEQSMMNNPYFPLNVVDAVNVYNLKAIEVEFDYFIVESYYVKLGDARCTLTEHNKKIDDIIEKFYNVKSDRVFHRFVYDAYVLVERFQSWGEENPDKVFCIIWFNIAAGLVAIMCSAKEKINYALSKGWIPVIDLESYKNQYLESDEVGRINAWEKFFEQPGGYSLEAVKKSKNIVIAPLGVNSKKSVGKISLNDFVIKERLMLEVNYFVKNFFAQGGRTLGVVVRGTDYVELKSYGHSIVPTLEEMVELVKEKMNEWGGYDRIYLCTEVTEAVLRFHEEFGEKVFEYPQYRYDGYERGYLSSMEYKSGSYRRGADYFIVLQALAKCDALIGPGCGAVGYAFELNQGEYENVYIIENGRYGSI